MEQLKCKLCKEEITEYREGHGKAISEVRKTRGQLCMLCYVKYVQVQIKEETLKKFAKEENLDKELWEG